MDEILVALILAFVTFALLLYLSRRSETKYPDGPFTFPILGNLPQIIASGDIVTFLNKYRKIYGNVYTMETGGVKRVVVSGGENMNHLLVKKAECTNTRSLKTMPEDKTLFSQSSPGIVWAPTPDWKIMRTLAINVMREEGMGKTVLEPKILAEIDLYVGHFIHPNLGKPINITESITFATSNIISRMAFGERFDYDDPELQILNTAVALATMNNTKASITKNIPFASYLPSSFSGQGTGPATDRAMQPVLGRMVAKTRKNLNTVQNHFMARALQKAQIQDDGSMQSVFTDENINSATAQLYGAGTETTSTTLSWALLYMILYPDIQERVRKEIHEVIGERSVSMKDKLSLPYTDAVINEVLRCGNIVPTSVPHTLEKELVIEGKVIPAGAELIFNVDSVVSNPELYPEPGKFKPERFLGSDGPALKSKIIVFGLGPRNCLGEPLARMEIFLFFVSFLQKYRVSYPAGRRPTLTPIVSIVRGPKAYEIIFEHISTK